MSTIFHPRNPAISIQSSRWVLTPERSPSEKGEETDRKASDVAKLSVTARGKRRTEGKLEAGDGSGRGEVGSRMRGCLGPLRFSCRVLAMADVYEPSKVYTAKIKSDPKVDNPNYWW